MEVICGCRVSAGSWGQGLSNPSMPVPRPLYLMGAGGVHQSWHTRGQVVSDLNIQAWAMKAPHARKTGSAGVIDSPRRGVMPGT